MTPTGYRVWMSVNRRVRLFKDPVSALTHFLGFLGAVVALVFLVVATAHDGPKVTGMALYGASLISLFLASTAYHFLDLGERGNRWLRRLDHGAIFLLIAGTYIPPILHLLDGAWRISMLSTVCGLALVGAAFKMAWVNCPNWLSVGLYLTLGWIVVVPGYKILPQLPAWPLGWLIAGGVAYSIGAVIYALKWPDPWPKRMGHHEIWHLFVLAGAFAHFVFSWWLVDFPRPPF
jgi:hemolysin III